MKPIPLVQMSDAAELLYLHIAEKWAENGNKCQEMPHLIKLNTYYQDILKLSKLC